MNSIETKQISTIGGGLSATAIAIMVALHYAKAQKFGYGLPPLALQLNDQNAAFGSGLPYTTRDTVFSLNQNADAMSPFMGDPGHFTRYCGCGPNDFMPRAKYGAYLQNTLTRTQDFLHETDLPVTLKARPVKITDLAQTGDDWCLQAEDHETSVAQAIILADGHQHSSAFATFKDNQDFFGGHYTVDQVADALQRTQAQTVGVIGTGACMIDALRVLDAVDYQGGIRAFSRDLVEPWQYNPDDYARGMASYRLQFLDNEALAAQGPVTFGSSQAAFRNEMVVAQKAGYAMGHVLGAIDLTELGKLPWQTPEDLEKFGGLYRKTYGNPTSPESYALYSGLKQSGRLRLIGADISERTMQAGPQGFTVQPRQGDIAVPVMPVVFNGACYSRDPLASPFVAKAVDNDWLSIQSGAAAQSDQDNGLYVAGVATNRNKWGVETFRKDYDLIARRAFAHVFKTDAPDGPLVLPF